MIALVAATLFVAAVPDVAPITPNATLSANSLSIKAEPAVLPGVAVTLECTARLDGRVEDCQVLGETHPGLGFGEAAVALMRDAEVMPPPRERRFAHTIQFTPARD
ncbi:TonB family protein [Brevundimonas naejangsanensis]|uniref:TonB family protein n=1 Tax=Brevundimonas naejangsanensis TaxID=588932 RepID=UPI0026EC9C01|nr:TonB family protein [Brevundimonas naejangsanensis]